tara:strand:+ start:8327 stop:9232 length:906 start_codon:yes stop_codon:yes gene_type:complete
MTYLCADIFGTDNRQAVYPYSSTQKYARSVAVGVINSLWSENGRGGLELLVDPLSERMCASERFSYNPSVSYACTGFLIAEDVLVTAGHCGTHVRTEIRDETKNYCEAYTWLFDYQETRPRKINTNHINKDNLYRCKKILYAVNDEGDLGRDFAIIKLDRKVKGRTPLKIASHSPAQGDAVSMLGHPMGMPMKYTHSAYIFEFFNQSYNFKTNLDAFAGNSGSPVFNKNMEVVGVLVAGNPSLSTYYDKKKKCERYNRCDNNGRNCIEQNIGEEGFPHTYSKVQKISKYLDELKRAKNLLP